MSDERGVDMAETLQEQKNKKKQSILSAAYNCFLEKGIHKVSIDEIVKNANVAKGTFYLYFKDKADVMREICVSISKKLVIEAFAAIQHNRSEDFAENIIAFVDYIIEYFKAHKLVLKMLERNFSWPLIESELSREQQEPQLGEIMNTLFASKQAAGIQRMRS
jgi:AcrR family transcriptional regulator